MLLTNARVLNRDFSPERRDLRIEGERFAPLSGSGKAEERLDLPGCLVVPGLVDIHIHGFMGCNVLDASEEALEKLCLRLAGRGVTSFVPTLAAAEPETTLAAIARLRRLAERGTAGAAIRGLYLEGPFVSPRKSGALRKDCLRPPDTGLLEEYADRAGGWLKIVAAAPELPGAEGLIRVCAARGIVAAIANTEADYEQATAAFSWGASHVTHLYNAMPPCLHRAPGVVGAAGDSEATAEIVCDGFHVHPAVIRQAYARLGGERLILVSDNVMMAGLPDGAYVMDGVKSVIRDGASRLEDGTINGGTHDLFYCVKQALSFGIPPQAAWKMASLTPAGRIGAAGEIGTLEVGKRADCLVLGEDGGLRLVFAGGRKIEVG